jgi:hypothetical protein
VHRTTRRCEAIRRVLERNLVPDEQEEKGMQETAVGTALARTTAAGLDEAEGGHRRDVEADGGAGNTAGLATNCS